MKWKEKFNLRAFWTSAIYRARLFQADKNYESRLSFRTEMRNLGKI